MDFDVIVVGAGPGGCVAAAGLAKAGFNVGLFDSNPRERIGKPIIIELEKSVFDEVGVSFPKPDEIPYKSNRTRVFSVNRKEAFSIESEHPGTAIYLDKFVLRLLKDAESSGARFYGNFKAVNPLIDSGGVVGAEFDETGRSHEIRAKLVIDATGYNATLVRNLGAELEIEFPDDSRDTVIAANYLHEIDEFKARKAVADGIQGDEETWSRLGFAGSYSTEYSHLSLRNRKAYILVGRKKEYDAPPVEKLIDDFIERRDYFGKRLYGGCGLIRISHSLDQLVADGFMVVGEAACQVIPMHGSGVASALYAGRLAATVSANALKEGAPTISALWPYSWLYQKGRGKLLATFDVSRLTVESFTMEQTARMMESGIMQAEDVYNAMIPQDPAMSLSSMPARIIGLAKNTNLIAPILRMGFAAMAVKKLYSKYPSRYSASEFADWKREKARIFRPFRERD